MTMSPLALQAKRVIESAWLHGAPYDLASQAAFALESTQMLQSPETAAEGALSADAVRVAEESVAELKREHEENARLRARIAELEAEKERTAEHTEHLGSLLVARTEELLRTEGEHYPSVHHAYRLGRDLPELGGAR
jgi:hypothetical protein